jgi:glycosyltransferase involved in cell wall biosynthesis
MKLSVMMITYNHERLIAQTIEIVLAQGVKFDNEIVINKDCLMAVRVPPSWTSTA